RLRVENRTLSGEDCTFPAPALRALGLAATKPVKVDGGRVVEVGFQWSRAALAQGSQWLLPLGDEAALAPPPIAAQGPATHPSPLPRAEAGAAAIPSVFPPG